MPHNLTIHSTRIAENSTKSCARVLTAEEDDNSVFNNPSKQLKSPKNLLQLARNSAYLRLNCHKRYSLKNIKLSKAE